MKAKHISIVCVAAVIITTAVSCKKLTEYNPGGSTAEAVWSTPEGMLTLVNACYADQRNFYGKEDAILMTEGGTDIWFNANKSNYANQLTRYESFTPASSGTNRNTFRTLYKALNLCNAGIDRIKNVTYPTVEERNRREGEMRFMRAFYLWHIVEFYGGVRLKLTETKEPELTAQRSTVAEFYEAIFQDLEFAKEHLPVSWGAEYSRATKKSAYGLLARAALSRAYYSTGAEAQTYFTKARDVAKEAIDKRVDLKVALNPSYTALWLPANNKNIGKDNGESMHTISNSATNLPSNYDGNGNRMHLWYLMQYSGRIGGLIQSLEYGNDGQRRLMPSLSLIEYFDETKDGRFLGTFQDVWLANVAYTWTSADATRYKKDASVVGKQVKVGDTIMMLSKQAIANHATKPYIIFDLDTMYLRSTTRAIYGVTNFFPVKKFAYPNRTAANAQPGFNDIFAIRFAEMYMIAAEAEFQLGNANAAAGYINVLRTRAAIKAPVDQTNAMQVTAADISLDFILEERAREFAGEHLRWFDVKRIKNNNNFSTFIKARNPDINAVQDYHRLRPVPQEELDALLNKAEFGQNPGYN